MRDLLTDAARKAPAGSALAAEVIDGKVRFVPAVAGAEVVGFMTALPPGPAVPWIEGGVIGGVDVGLSFDDDVPPHGTPIYFHRELNRLVLESAGDPPVGYVVGTALFKSDGKLRRAANVKLFRMPQTAAPEPQPEAPPEAPPEEPAKTPRTRRTAAK